MRSLTLLALIAFSQAIFAQELHTFSNGDVADAEKINENFEALKGAINGSGAERVWVNRNGKLVGWWHPLTFHYNSGNSTSRQFSYSADAVAVKVKDRKEIYFIPWGPFFNQRTELDIDTNQDYEAYWEWFYADYFALTDDGNYRNINFPVFESEDCTGPAYVYGQKQLGFSRASVSVIMPPRHERSFLVPSGRSGQFLRRAQRIAGTLTVNSQLVMSPNPNATMNFREYCKDIESTVLTRPYWRLEETNLNVSDYLGRLELRWMD